MKAAIFRKINAPLVIEEIEIDDPQPRAVLVRSAAAGVCHSDRHIIEGLLTYPAAEDGWCVTNRGTRGRRVRPSSASPDARLVLLNLPDVC